MPLLKPLRLDIWFYLLLHFHTFLLIFIFSYTAYLPKSVLKSEYIALQFGKGVYFADLVSKSAQYCFTDKKNPVGLMLLSEVALGDVYELKKAKVNLV